MIRKISQVIAKNKHFQSQVYYGTQKECEEFISSMSDLYDAELSIIPLIAVF